MVRNSTAIHELDVYENRVNLRVDSSRGHSSTRVVHPNEMRRTAVVPPLVKTMEAQIPRGDEVNARGVVEVDARHVALSSG